MRQSLVTLRNTDAILRTAGYTSTMTSLTWPISNSPGVCKQGHVNYHCIAGCTSLLMLITHRPASTVFRVRSTGGVIGFGLHGLHRPGWENKTSEVVIYHECLCDRFIQTPMGRLALRMLVTGVAI
jgi:hypothetical protein